MWSGDFEFPPVQVFIARGEGICNEVCDGEECKLLGEFRRRLPRVRVFVDCGIEFGLTAKFRLRLPRDCILVNCGVSLLQFPPPPYPV